MGHCGGERAASATAGSTGAVTDSSNVSVASSGIITIEIAAEVAIATLVLVVVVATIRGTWIRERKQLIARSLSRADAMMNVRNCA